MLTLFDEKIERISRLAKYSESHYKYLNISDRPEFRVIRTELEHWFSNYPDKEKNEFIRRFQSNNNDQFLSAFFELYIHEILLKLNYKIKIHPDISSSGNHPDFLVKSKRREEFYHLP